MKWPKLRFGGTFGLAGASCGGLRGRSLHAGGSLGQEVAGSPVGEQASDGATHKLTDGTSLGGDVRRTVLL
jgi:hypothetical protein